MIVRVADADGNRYGPQSFRVVDIACASNTNLDHTTMIQEIGLLPHYARHDQPCIYAGKCDQQYEGHGLNQDYWRELVGDIPDDHTITNASYSVQTVVKPNIERMERLIADYVVRRRWFEHGERP